MYVIKIPIMTIAELQKEFLTSAGKRIAPEDFSILLAHALQREKVFLFTHPEYVLEKEEESRARAFFSRREQREPVALITGHKEFYGRDFAVTPDTLIPRPETELIVEHALQTISDLSSDARSISFIDIGTGSGCIAISVAATLAEKNPLLFSDMRFFATDISLPALSIAKSNAALYQVSSHITFLSGDLLTPYIPYKTEEAALVIITANLPYLAQDLYDAAPEDVRAFEPRSALVSDKAGLDHYYRLLQSLTDIFTDTQSLILFLEISPEQSAPLRHYTLALFPHTLIHSHNDLAGKERIVEIRLPASSSRTL